MSSLKIRLEIPHLNQTDVPVTTEVFNEKMEKLQTILVSREARLEDLAPGFYLVRAVLPSGEINTVPVQIAEETEVEAVLKTSASPHEWLAGQQFLGAYRRPTRRAAPEEQTMERSLTSQNAWIRIWSFQGDDLAGIEPFPYTQDSRWQLETMSDWSPYPHTSDDTPDLTAVDLQVPSGAPFRYRVLQIGGDSLPWRLVVIPPLAATGPDSLQVLVRPSHSGVRLDGGVAVKLITRDLETESLSHSLESGDTLHSARLAQQVLDEAERALAEDIPKPYGALVAGYYLVGTRDLGRLRSWVERFAYRFEWLPDAAILYAWQILLDNDLENKHAADGLLEAIRRGLPVFKQGLRYLVDGLETFTGLTDRKSQHLERMLGQLRPFTRAANWNQRLVTYYGKAPYLPSEEAVTGMPEQPQFLQFPLPIDARVPESLEVAPAKSPGVRRIRVAARKSLAKGAKR